MFPPSLPWQHEGMSNVAATPTPREFRVLPQPATKVCSVQAGWSIKRAVTNTHTAPDTTWERYKCMAKKEREERY